MRAVAQPKIPTQLLIASESFGQRLSAERVAAALAAGISDRRGPVHQPHRDTYPQPAGRSAPRLRRHPALQLNPKIEPEPCPIKSSDDLLGCIARIRAARALIIAVPRLDQATMLRSIAFELATQARQTGVPCFAVTADNNLSPFDARILDLQVILQAASERSLRDAGRKLAQII